MKNLFNIMLKKKLTIQEKYFYSLRLLALQLKKVKDNPIKGDAGPIGLTGPKGDKGDPGLPGRDGIDGVNGKDGKDGKDGSSDTPEQIRDKLSSLKDDEKVDISIIKGYKGDTDLDKKIAKWVAKNIHLLQQHGSGINSKSFIDNETPGGPVNGVNVTFTLIATPIAGTLKFYINGIRQHLTDDYTLVANVITCNTAPPLTSILICDYRYV
jgi:hypothetical protein